MVLDLIEEFLEGEGFNFIRLVRIFPMTLSVRLNDHLSLGW